MNESADATTTKRSHIIIQSRQGGHFRIPVSKLTDYSVPEGAVVIEWRPGRYLLLLPEALEEFRMSDEEVLPFALEARVRGVGGRRRRHRLGPHG